MIGTLVGHYRIISPLGGGSMGEVFKAENTHLSNQFVAIKFLGSKVIDKPSSRERFQRETRAIASLNHPNICAVQDAGELQGRPYIVMEYLDGKSLRELLTSAPLDPELVLSLGIQLCDGLQAAHSNGIIHRDIKPSNIVLTATGHAKLLDFGLAKLVDNGLVFNLSSLTTEHETLTGEGALVGTVPYMSPEQALGKPLNQRSDLFSMGVVLYELAGGVHPFRGDTQAAICDEIIHRNPPSIIRMNPLLPHQFDGFFQRALEKDPECRFQTAADMRATLVQIQRKLQHEISGDRPGPKPKPKPWPKALLRIGVPLLLVLAILFTWNPTFMGRVGRMFGISNLPEKRWVAVLPFDVHCEKGNQQFFVEGLRLDLEGELLSLSKQSQTFRVIPLRASDEIESPREAGRELGVNLVLMGSLTCQGQNGIIHLTLISTEDDGLVEAERIDGSLENRNDLAARTRRSVQGMLQLRIQVAGTGTLAAAPDLEGLFLEGKGFLSRYEEPESLKKAVERFEKVIEEAPDFAPAYAGLAEAYRHLYTHEHSREWIDRGVAAADLAVVFDEKNPGSFTAKGWMLVEFGQWKDALDVFDKALELAPEDSNALRGRARALKDGNRPDEALREYQKVIELHPDGWAGYRELAQHYWDLGDYEQALSNFQKVRTFLPNSFRAVGNVVAAYTRLEEWDLAEAVVKELIEEEDNFFARDLLGTCYWRQKRFEEAAEEYEKALELDDSDWALWGNLGGMYKHLNRPEEAERCFEEAMQRVTGALEINPEDAEFRLDYADYLYELGEEDESLRQLELVEVLPELDTDPSLMYLMGQVYEKCGRRQDAIDWVIKALEDGWPRETVESSPTMKDFVQDPEWIRRAELIDNSN